ncbi:MAG: AsmA-like C-terminal region-containing protein [Candidatus Eisenbacteria bacterium]
MKPRARKGILIGTVLAAVVILTLFLVLRSLHPAERLRQMAEEKLQEVTGLRITVERAGVSLVHWRVGVKVRGVEVGRPDSTGFTELASVPELGVSVALLPMLRRQIVVEELYVERPRVELRLGESTGVVKGTARPAERRPLPVSLRLSRVVVRGGRVEVLDLRSGSRALAEQLSVSMKLDAERTAGTIRMDGKFSTKSLSIVPGQEGPLPAVSYPVQGTWQIRYGLQERRLDVDRLLVRVSELPVELRGSVAMSEQPPEMEIVVSVENASAGTLLSLLPPESAKKTAGVKVRGELDLKAEIEGTAKSPRVRGEFMFVNGAASAPGMSVERLEARGRFDANSVDIQRINAKIGSSEFLITGRVEDLKRRLVSLEVTSPHVNLEELLLASGQSGLGPRGSSGQQQPGLAPLPATGTAGLRIDRLVLKQFVAEGLNARVSFNEDSIAVKEISMRALGGSCVGRGEVVLARREAPTYEGTFSASDIHVSELLRTFTPLKEFMRGNTSVEVSLNGKLAKGSAPTASLSAAGSLQTSRAAAIASPLVASLAGWVGLEKKKEYEIRDFATPFRVEGGRIIVPRCALVERSSTWEFSGSLGLDGTLEHLVTVTLSRDYSQKVNSLKGLDQLVKDDEGRIVVDLIVGGTVKSPAVKWDTSRMRARVRGLLAKKVEEQLAGEKEKVEELKQQTKSEIERKARELQEEAGKKGKKLLDEMLKKK